MVTVHAALPPARYFPAPDNVANLVREVSGNATSEPYDAVVTVYRADASSADLGPRPTIPIGSYGRAACCFNDFGWPWAAGYVGVVLPTWTDNLFVSDDQVGWGLDGKLAGSEVDRRTRGPPDAAVAAALVQP